MSDAATRRCPRCGKTPSDRLLVQCPECKVPFVYENERGPDAGLTPAQLKAVARHVFTSWKFWAGVVVIVAGAAWGVVEIAERFIDLRSEAYLNTLEQKTTNHIAVAYGQLSNQIALELKQPKIKSTIEQVAAERANDFLTNAVWPSLQAFQEQIELANAQLTRSTNDLTQLAKSVTAAQRQAAQVAPTASDGPSKLILADRAISRNGADYVLTLYFKTTGNKPLGTVDLVAGTFRQTAKILSFACLTPGQTEPAVMNNDGDASRIKFNVNASDAPTVALELSAPTIVRLTGDALFDEITVAIAADKMQLPAGAR